jgi:hypothetical protein
MTKAISQSIMTRIINVKHLVARQEYIRHGREKCPSPWVRGGRAPYVLRLRGTLQSDTPGVQDFVKLASRLALHRGQHLAVGVHRDPNLRMPQPLLNGLRVNAGRKQERRRGMSQIVETQVGKLGLLE